MDNAFTSLLPATLLDAVERELATVFGCWPDGRIAYFNSAYEAFARDNGGGPEFLTKWGLGCSIFDVTAPPLVPFFREHFVDALDGHVATYVYECSSPARKREFHATLYPVGERRGVLQLHSLRFELPQEPERAGSLDAMVRDQHSGLVVMCMHCRRARRVDDRTQWVFVPAWVKQMPSPVSHGLCEPCSEHFYPEAAKS